MFWVPSWLAQAEGGRSSSRRCRSSGRSRRKVHNKVSEEGRTHQSLMCCGVAPPLQEPCGPCGPCGPSRQARQGFTSLHTRIHKTRRGTRHNPHTWEICCCRLHLPLHAGPCKPCRARACPRLRTKLPGFASPTPTTDAPPWLCGTWPLYPYSMYLGQTDRPSGWRPPERVLDRVISEVSHSAISSW